MHKENVRRIQELLEPLTGDEIEAALVEEVRAWPYMAQGWLARLYNVAGREIQRREAGDDPAGIAARAEMEAKAEGVPHA